MIKQVVLRGLLGFPLGIAVGQIISIIISLNIGNGDFLRVVPSLIIKMGNEINAVILVTICTGIIGSVFYASSLIFQKDNWSIIKQTLIHFCITCGNLLIIASVAGWIGQSLHGMVVFFIIMCINYIFIWIIQMLIWQHRIKLLNKKIKEF